MDLSDSRSRRRPSGGVWGGNPRVIGSPPITRVALSTCRAHYPGGSQRVHMPASFPVAYSLPRYAGGSASASLLSRPAQASLPLRPADSRSAAQRRPLSQGFSPPITRTSCLSATRPNRLLSRWSLPPPATHPFGAHCAKSRRAHSASKTRVNALTAHAVGPCHAILHTLRGFGRSKNTRPTMARPEDEVIVMSRDTKPEVALTQCKK